MSNYYRNKNNEPIDSTEWFALKNSEILTTETYIVDGKNVDINMRYFGTVGSVFKVWVVCSSDLVKYFGYLKHYIGELEASNDFNRLVVAIVEGLDIFDETKQSGQISIYYDVRFNQHIVIDNRNYPEVDFCYLTRPEAELKYSQLGGV